MQVTQHSAPCEPAGHPSCRSARLSTDMRAAISRAEQRAATKHQEQSELIRVAEARQAELDRLQNQIQTVRWQLEAAKVSSAENTPSGESWSWATLFSALALGVAGVALYYSNSQRVTPMSPAVIRHASKPIYMASPSRAVPNSPLAVPLSPLPTDLDTKSLAELEVGFVKGSIVIYQGLSAGSVHPCIYATAATEFRSIRAGLATQT